MKIGLYGGTFDPIHTGHLLLAEWTRVELNLTKIVFIPALIPPHKQHQYITPAQVRFEMVRLAIQGNRYFEVSDVEIAKGDTSYSIATILQFRNQYHLSNKQLYFLIGADSMIDFPNWRCPEQILQNCQVIVYKRPNIDLSRAKKKHLEKVLLINNPIIEISSTDIRERVQKNHSIKYMVPPLLEEFILKKLLYKKFS